MRFDPVMLATDERPMIKRVAELLRECIDDGRLSPDEVLPPVRQIAADLKVGYDLVQDALKFLEGEALVVTTRGIGFKVRTRPQRRIVSGDRYRRQIAALRDGSNIGSAFCEDHGISWDQYTVHAVPDTYVHTEAGRHIAQSTGWRPDEPVIRRNFVELADGLPIQVRTSIIPLWLADEYEPLADPTVQPVYGGLFAELHAAGHLPSRVTEWQRVRFPTSRETPWLDIGDRTPVWEWSRIVRHGDTVVELSDTILPYAYAIFVQEVDL